VIGVRATAHALADRIAPGAVVLLYHRVADLDFDPQLLAVKPANFAAQLDWLQSVATLVPLQELARRRGSGRGLVAITFDDGYADNLYEAKPQLVRRGIPATVFVSSGYCASGHEFWWDELERIVLRPYGVQRYRALIAALGKASAGERERTLEQLRASASSPAAARPSHRPMTPQEVRELQSDGITVGAHTVSHPRLSALDAEAQEREIGESQRELERMTGTPVRTFAYPFGGRGDYTRASVASARAHFDVACSNFPATVRARTSRFELPRFLVRDWSAAELQSRIGRLLRS